jgi:hypothetical protein
MLTVYIGNAEDLLCRRMANEEPVRAEEAEASTVESTSVKISEKLIDWSNFPLQADLHFTTSRIEE